MSNHELLAGFLEFQATGRGFETVWTGGIGEIVVEMTWRQLRKMAVKEGWNDDESAVADVVGSTVEKLMSLGKPGTTGRFDPARAPAAGISGLRGWLWRVVKNQAVNWVRRNRGGRNAKIVPVSGLRTNELTGGDKADSLIERRAAKAERGDLLPVLERCINRLSHSDLRAVMQLKLDGELSERQIGVQLGVSAATVSRRLQQAYKAMRTLLEAEGVDVVGMTA